MLGFLGGAAGAILEYTAQVKRRRRPGSGRSSWEWNGTAVPSSPAFRGSASASKQRFLAKCTPVGRGERESESGVASTFAAPRPHESAAGHGSANEKGNRHSQSPELATEEGNDLSRREASED